MLQLMTDGMLPILRLPCMTDSEWLDLCGAKWQCMRGFCGLRVVIEMAACGCRHRSSPVAYCVPYRSAGRAAGCLGVGNDARVCRGFRVDMCGGGCIGTTVLIGTFALSMGATPFL